MEFLIANTNEKSTSSLPLFDALIVDEATQATEPELLVALQHQAKLVILVGDEMQLPPTVSGEKARRAPRERRRVGGGKEGGCGAATAQGRAIIASDRLFGTNSESQLWRGPP